MRNRNHRKFPFDNMCTGSHVCFFFRLPLRKDCEVGPAMWDDLSPSSLIRTTSLSETVLLMLPYLLALPHALEAGSHVYGGL